MRRRITLAIVGMVVAALILAGFGTFVLERANARDATRQELERQTQAFVNLLDEPMLLRIVGASQNSTATANQELRRILIAMRGLARNIEDQDIGILTGAQWERLEGTGPRGVTLTAADIEAVRTDPDKTISGNRGSNVFAATAGEVRALKYVVIVARPPATSARPAFGWFLLASAFTVAIGALVAVRLSGQLTKRLRAAQAATHAIAAGDLSARIDTAKGDAPVELQDLARSINSMAEQLERSRGLERQFLMSITHDLRTPLTSIQGYAEALVDGAIDDPKRAGEIIGNESQRLQRLVSDLLDLSRLEARTFNLDLTVGDVGPAVAATVEAFEPKAVAANIELLTNCASGFTSRVDPQRLAQVVSNLLDNALKFASRQINVFVTRHDGWIVIGVSDDGPGIAPADLPYVFERLYVAKARPTPKESGSGLGLAIVRELAAAMGGQVRADSPDPHTGKGTRFSVYLPGC